MARNDAIVDVEDWISEHFFISEAKGESFQKAVLDRRKEWDELDGPEGSPRTRFTGSRSKLLDALTALYSDGDTDPATTAQRITDLYRDLRTILGYASGEFHVETAGPARFYNTLGVTADAPFVILDAKPVDALDELLPKDQETLLCPFPVSEKDQLCSVSRTLSHLFVREDGPKFALVMAGRWLVVAERSRWPEGRFLAVDVQTVADRNDAKRGGEIDKALACLAADSLAPDADGAIWWTGILEESIKHTVGVSQDLREGVRLSVELIANDVVQRRKAKGLPPLPADQAQPLARQSLRFIYRILFLLYAEASPELGVLPVGAPEYQDGYSLDRLRDLTLVELGSPHARTGTHLYDSLGVLFRLVDQGHHAPAPDPEAGESGTQGLEFNSLRADLFLPKAIEHIGEVKLGNAALQQVLRHLLLSKEQKGRDRGYISYVDLGINQLGAVYEGLMSYTGFFAENDLYEVAKNGNAEKGSWVVPVERAHDIAESDFVTTTDPITGETKPVMHARGTFVFRLSGRERQQSASYYSPEVITRFTVSQALEELLDRDGQRTPARDILDLTVCEPALGSGAFTVEAVRQLAEQYLTRRQEELGKRIDPDQYPQELQKVKASIALHQIYGVDLNAQAVEFAEITLWLDSMSKDLQAPWFGLHLRRGNSLIGARHAMYSRDEVTSRAWLTKPAADVPLTGLAEAVHGDGPGIDRASRIHHFLLPAEGWGSTSESKEAKDLVPERVRLIKAWRKSLTKKPTTKQLTALQEIAHQVEALWTLAYRRLVVAEQESRRGIKLWGLEETVPGSTVTREQIEKSLADEDGAYRRLRRVMDAWCALWFWPLHGDQVWTNDDQTRIAPPSLDQWIDALTQLVGSNKQARRAAQHGADMLRPDDAWAALAAQEDFEIKGAGGRSVAEVKGQHPWLQVCEDVAAGQGFFHWQLDFATVFGRGGFDLQVGNPPWVRPDVDADALLAEGDPWWQLANRPSEAERRARREETLALQGVIDALVSSMTETVAVREAVGSSVLYPMLEGLRPDLYRCFMLQTWVHSSSHGVVALVHPETHFTDEKAGPLRRETYIRLRRHWQFINELKLYEIDDKRLYGIHVYGAARKQVRFLSAASLYHPDTVERSLHHRGEGEQPGFKDPNTGTWDLRPHNSRIIHVTNEVLESWCAVLEENSTSISETRMVSTVNTAVADVLAQLARSDRIGSLGLQFSTGWNEKTDREKGRFESSWGTPSAWRDVILQGPHLHVATPFYKSPNPTMKHNQDWSATDFETLAADALPVTAYRPTGELSRYDAEYTHWPSKPARDFYRIAWRRMAANKNERTLISALIPPGAAHVHPVNSGGSPRGGGAALCLAAGHASSLLADFFIRTSPRADIHASTFTRLPMVCDHPLRAALLLRTLRLNCVTDAYADLWREVWNATFGADAWAGGVERPNRPVLGDVGPEWSASSALRIPEDRRNALVELDALVALMLGVTADQLCTVYRTQFAVLYGYDHNTYLYDANGRLVPNSVLTVWRKKGDRITEEERTATNQAGNTYTYELPFRVLDREADMRGAYAEFERRLAERS